MHFDEDYFSDDKRLSRIERKRLSKKDRSKYKKTDQVQAPVFKRNDLPKGRVLSITSQGIIVDYEGKNWTCLLRGSLKKEKTLAKNLVAVGDFVHFEKVGDFEGAIEWVEPRKSTLSRADNLSRLKEQVIAANIDQVLITASLANPELKPSLLDRYVIAAKIGGMTPVILINKIDLLPTVPQEVKELYDELLVAYEKAHILVIPISVENGTGIEELKSAMQGKASVFSGQSGVGKSSLINAVTGFALEVGETVQRTKKGAHTTTKAQLLRLPCGGFCIDTPGVQSFGVWNLEEDQVRHFYKEIGEVGKKCRFPNCTHVHEPECAVVKAVKRGKISFVRYESYLSLLEEIDREHRRR